MTCLWWWLTWKNSRRLFKRQQPEYQMMKIYKVEFINSSYDDPENPSAYQVTKCLEKFKSKICSLVETPQVWTLVVTDIFPLTNNTGQVLEAVGRLVSFCGKTPFQVKDVYQRRIIRPYDVLFLASAPACDVIPRKQLHNTSSLFAKFKIRLRQSSSGRPFLTTTCPRFKFLTMTISEFSLCQ